MNSEEITFKNHLKTINENTLIIKQKLSLFKSNFIENNLQVNNGVSLLNVRLITFLAYLSNLTLLSISKLNNNLKFKDSIIWNLVQFRNVLEKSKPLELKLKYQIDKLIKMATLNTDNQNSNILNANDSIDPLQFKPNPSSMFNDDNENADDGKKSKNKQDTDNSGIYRPPRLAPLHYDPDQSLKKTKLSSHLRDVASKSRLIRDLQTQYDDRPEEYDAEGTGYGAREVGASKEDEIWKEREAFEEENFIRMNMSKKDKKMAMKIGKQGGLMRFRNEFDDLQKDFNDISGIHKAVEKDERLNPKQTKRKQMYGEEEDKLKKHKRKYGDANEMISSMAKVKNNFKGKDAYSATKKTLKGLSRHNKKK
ncbi:hypothetical protein BC833DRAFT_585750 [Globomyces pollinis-pini]|nr:hypothetical protein BC833DRAFT_585750 [Globomyces pollinis-pini]